MGSHKVGLPVATSEDTSELHTRRHKEGGDLSRSIKLTKSWVTKGRSVNLLRALNHRHLRSTFLQTSSAESGANLRTPPQPPNHELPAKGLQCEPCYLPPGPTQGGNPTTSMEHGDLPEGR